MIRHCLVFAGSLVLLTACQSGPARGSAPDRPSADPSARQGLLTAPPIALVFVSLDANGDQMVTREEMETGVSRLFSDADRNGSASLDPAELRSFFLSHLGSEYPVPGRIAFDPDGDQLVGAEEFAAVFAGAFSRLDQDADAQLVRAELIREIAMGSGRPQGRAGQGRARRGGGGRSAG